MDDFLFNAPTYLIVHAVPLTISIIVVWFLCKLTLGVSGSVKKSFKKHF